MIIDMCRILPLLNIVLICFLVARAYCQLRELMSMKASSARAKGFGQDFMRLIDRGNHLHGRKKRQVSLKCLGDPLPYRDERCEAR
jgi:hypothetical protein